MEQFANSEINKWSLILPMFYTPLKSSNPYTTLQSLIKTLEKCLNDINNGILHDSGSLSPKIRTALNKYRCRSVSLEKGEVLWMMEKWKVIDDLVYIWDTYELEETTFHYCYTFLNNILKYILKMNKYQLLSKTQIFSLIDGVFNILHNKYTMETKRLLVYMQDIGKSHWQLSKPQPMPRTPKP